MVKTQKVFTFLCLSHLILGIWIYDALGLVSLFDDYNGGKIFIFVWFASFSHNGFYWAITLMFVIYYLLFLRKSTK